MSRDFEDNDEPGDRPRTGHTERRNILDVSRPAPSRRRPPDSDDGNDGERGPAPRRFRTDDDDDRDAARPFRGRRLDPDDDDDRDDRRSRGPRDDDRPRPARARREADDERRNDRDDRGSRSKPRDDDEDDAGGASDDDAKGGDQKNGDKKKNGDGKNDTKKGDDKKGDDKKDGKSGDDSKKDGDDEALQARRKRRPLIYGIVAVVVLLGLLGGGYYYLSHRNLVDTDDAYTDGNVVTIAPQVSGQVVALEVNDNQFVRKGDVLVRIDPRQFQYDREQAQGTFDSTNAQVASQQLGVEIAKKNFPAALELAKANLESAQANLTLQKSNYERQKGLPKQATTQQEVDAATSNYATAQAQVDQAEARVTQAEPVQQNIGQSQQQVSQIQGQVEQARGRLDQTNLNIEWSVVRAPQDGWVTRRNVNAGNYVSAGTQIMSLVTTDLWVTANYKETQLDGMRPGQQVRITVDAYPDLDLHGHVDSIQRGSGSKFSAFPAENATGNFIKIVQRVPVKIIIDSGLKNDEPLPLGVSVEPTVSLK